MMAASLMEPGGVSWSWETKTSGSTEVTQDDSRQPSL